ncbi:MAG: LysR substrate-binding domain-containing protein [Lautropia sp.]|nr:LysR substrate-binding domain-containing protein [Lautropia sp.]
MFRNFPISVLRTFEAAARTGSFRAAAHELCLSPSAVSHAIRRLEESLGTALFRRSTRSIRLTPAGEALYTHVDRALEALRQGLEEVGSKGPSILRLHSAPSFAAQWLMPRLRAFLARHPNIDLRLAANTDQVRFEYDEFDLDIVYGKPSADGQVVIPLVEELLTPLCSPELAGRIHSVADLASVPLIQSDVKQIRWSGWFEAQGQPLPPLRGARFDRSFMAIAAAADGWGVALESPLLAEREMAAGKLVRPLAGIEREVRYIGHFLSYSRATRRTHAIGVFKDWLQQALESLAA